MNILKGRVVWLLCFTASKKLMLNGTVVMAFILVGCRNASCCRRSGPHPIYLICIFFFQCLVLSRKVNKKTVFFNLLERLWVLCMRLGFRAENCLFGRGIFFKRIFVVELMGDFKYLFEWLVWWSRARAPGSGFQ